MNNIKYNDMYIGQIQKLFYIQYLQQLMIFTASNIVIYDVKDKKWISFEAELPHKIEDCT